MSTPDKFWDSKVEEYAKTPISDEKNHQKKLNETQFYLVRGEGNVKISRNSPHAREQTTHCCGLVLRTCALHGQRYY